MEDILTNPLIIAAIIGIISAIFGKRTKKKRKATKTEKASADANCFSSKKQAEEVSVPIPNRMEQVRREAEERRRKQKET